MLLYVPSKLETHYRTLIKGKKETESGIFGLEDCLWVVNTTQNPNPTKEALDLLQFPVPGALPKSCCKMTNAMPQL